MKTIYEITKDYCCPQCEKMHYNVFDELGKYITTKKAICNKNTLHLSMIYVRDIVEGVAGTKVFGFRKIQKAFIEGYYAAQNNELLKEAKSEYDYLSLAYNDGFKSFNIFKN